MRVNNRANELALMTSLLPTEIYRSTRHNSTYERRNLIGFAYLDVRRRVRVARGQPDGSFRAKRLNRDRDPR